MPIDIKNQTIYKCQYCGKRYLTKQGCKKHEIDYCKSPNAPRVINCKHKEVVTVWIPIVGEENRQEPDYDYCIDCGVVIT